MNAGIVPIAELADILHARSNPWKAMALLRAFFDESGMHGDAHVTGLGGFIADADAWTDLEDKWGDYLPASEIRPGRIYANSMLQSAMRVRVNGLASIGVFETHM